MTQICQIYDILISAEILVNSGSGAGGGRIVPGSGRASSIFGSLRPHPGSIRPPPGFL